MKIIYLVTVLFYVFYAQDLTAGYRKPNIPIYIEDNHSGSFYFLSEHLDWDQKYTLILFDMHHDSRAIPDSDIIRNILKAYQHGNKNDFYKKWKANGVIQCFNWIEPLMPHPIERVVWVPSKTLSLMQKKNKASEVNRFLNANVFMYKRKNADLTPHYQIMSFNDLKKLNLRKKSVVVSIDLDYFTGLPSGKTGNSAGKQLGEVFDYIVKQNLHCLTIAISRPYLQSDAESYNLFYHALNNTLNIINSKIYFKPFQSNEPDRSDLAKLYYKQNKKVPYFNISNCTTMCKSLIVNYAYRLITQERTEDWEELLKKWRHELHFPRIILLNGNNNDAQAVSYHSFTTNKSYLISIANYAYKPGDKIVWKALCPASKSFSICNNKSFAKGSFSVIYYVEKEISSNNDKLQLHSDAIQYLFDNHTHSGTTRIFAEIYTAKNSYRSNMLTITQRINDLYLGELTGIMNLPYVFGGSLIRNNGRTGADALYGAECSSFIIYGKRAMGLSVPYVDPAGIKKYMKSIYNKLSFKDDVAYSEGRLVTISEQEINNGLILHFGNHLAAVYKDNKPVGILDDSDLVIHQLENIPEIVPLIKLRKNRNLYEIMAFKANGK